MDSLIESFTLRAEEVLRYFVATNASFKFVRLSTKSWGIDAKVAKRAFENLKDTLEVVDLADTIAGRPGGSFESDKSSLRALGM